MTQPQQLDPESESLTSSGVESEVDGYTASEDRVAEPEIIINPFFRQYILLGYGAKGIIYSLIGMLAIEAAILPERRAAGTYNALKHLSHQPLGSVTLCLLAVGIFGYVVRRLLQATVYPGHSSGLTFQNVLQRGGYILSSISYAGVAYSAISIVFSLGKYNDRIQDWVEQLLDHAIAGKTIIFLGGMGVIGVGLGYIYGAYTGSYISKFATSYIDRRLEYWATWLGKIGIAARGISFIVTGICLILASLFSDSHFAGGLQKAFRVLAKQPLGWLWLSLIGSGFIAYGIYMFITAKYRRYVIR